jgi:hypothetical protein
VYRFTELIFGANFYLQKTEKKLIININEIRPSVPKFRIPKKCRNVITLEQNKQIALTDGNK